MPTCPDCGQSTSGIGRCPQCRVEHTHAGVDHSDDTAATCAVCGEHAPEGDYAGDRAGVWLCRACQALGLLPRQHDQLLAATPDALGGAVRWAVGDDDAYPEQDPGIETGFETASQRLVADGGLVECCPHDDCGSARIRANSQSPVGRDAEAAYRCKDCGRAIDELEEREHSGVGGGRHGLAGKLADPDVSDVSDLRTDGGGDEWAVEQRGLDGEPAQGQTTIDGGVAKDGGDQ